MNTAGDEVQRIYKEPWDGCIPRGVRCQRCNKLLNEDGNHIFESYLGTFNGLCGPCTAEPTYVAKTFRDGAKEISVPPACPSWRRDREKYIVYDDCPDCQGKGYKSIYGTNGMFNQGYRTCSDRYTADPLRRWHSERAMALMAAANRCFQEDLVRLGLSKRDRKRKGEPQTYSKAFPQPEDANNTMYEIQVKWLSRYEPLREKLEAMAVARGVFA
jgi:hypothetical protein